MGKKRYCKLDAQKQREINVLEQADYFISHKSTVRATAQVFHVSKSIIHRNLTQLLPKLSFKRYCSVKKIMDKNKAECHLRGGMATRQKYLAMKKH